MFRGFFSFVSLLVYLLIGAIIVAFAVTNRAPVEVSFYPAPYTMQLPLFVLSMLIFALGLVFGGIQSTMSGFKRKRELRMERKRIAALENEVATLKTELARVEPVPAQRLETANPASHAR